MLRLSTGLVNEITGIGGSSLADALSLGVIRFYSGPQPASADAAETGTLLCEISKEGLTFIPGTTTGALQLAELATGVLAKPTNDNWKGIAVANGNIGWYRHYSNLRTTGASTSAIRYDGTVGILGAGEIVLSHLDTLIGKSISLQSYFITLPQV